MGLEPDAHCRVKLKRLVDSLDFIKHLLTAFSPLDGFLTVKGAKLFYNRLLMGYFLLLIKVSL